MIAFLAAALLLLQAADSRPLIVCFGDSLTSGHGPAAEQNYPQFLQKEIDRQGLRYRVVNAGIEGDTTGSALARLPGILALRPRWVVLEFGGNDGLRGLPISTTQSNLDQLTGRLKAARIRVLLAGMTLPPNYGPDYIRRFEQVYKSLAAKHRVPLIPFLLEGVGGDPRLMQYDGIHPNAEGNRRVASTVFRALRAQGL